MVTTAPTVELTESWRCPITYVIEPMLHLHLISYMARFDTRCVISVPSHGSLRLGTRLTPLTLQLGRKGVQRDAPLSVLYSINIHNGLLFCRQQRGRLCLGWAAPRRCTPVLIALRDLVGISWILLIARHAHGRRRRRFIVLVCLDSVPTNPMSGAARCAHCVSTGRMPVAQSQLRQGKRHAQNTSTPTSV